MSEVNQQQDLAAQIKEYHQIGEFDRALDLSERALESNPADLDAYRSRWELIAEMFSEEEARKRIQSEIASFLRTQWETPEVLHTASAGYCSLPGGAKNVPMEVFDNMLQYPGTKVYQGALL
ncbi:MAG: hypothetical protein OXT74_15515, partial [Candidatus Poribacteria bacterium]|nr:hypothetical protein [Candidatus Poribacteria bacterium]